MFELRGHNLPHSFKIDEHGSYARRWQAWDAFLKLCFSGKNKTMRSLFGIKAMATRTQPETIVDPSQWRDALLACVESSGLSSHRANAMTLQEFLSLYRALLSAGAVFQPDDLSSDEETEPHTVVS